MQSELLKSQKLESLGVMAGGIAHDFNNILCGITGYITMAQQFIESRSQVGHYLSQARQDTGRAIEFVKKLLSFAKGGEPVKQRIDLHRILTESLQMATRNSQVQSRLVIAEDIDTLDADEGQIFQVFINIVTNSVQAMPDGGTIMIEAANSIPGEGEPAELAGSRYVKITVRDEGHGIPEEDQKKVFDPFFTRKSSGTGLGMTSCYAIVKRHGGCVFLSSQLGVGTTFAIYLPSRSNADEKTKLLSGRPVLSQPTLQGEAGARKALVMDDKLEVRNVVSAMLMNLEFQVTTCNDGG